jgi:hypothetical protein
MYKSNSMIIIGKLGNNTWAQCYTTFTSVIYEFSY